MFRYRLHTPDGDDLGEATYAMMIKPGEEIHLGAGQRFRVLDVVPFEEVESPFVGLLQVEAIGRELVDSRHSPTSDRFRYPRRFANGSRPQWSRNWFTNSRFRAIFSPLLHVL